MDKEKARKHRALKGPVSEQIHGGGRGAQSQSRRDSPRGRTASEGNNDRASENMKIYQAELEAQNLELRQMQEQLLYSRERYFRLFDAAPIGYLQVTRHGLIEDANKAAEELLGRRQSDLRRRLLSRFILPEDLPVHLFNLAALAKKGGRVSYEVRLTQPSGGFRYVQVTAQKSHDMIINKASLLITISDISRLKEAEQFLAQKKADLEHIHKEVKAKLDQSSRSLNHETRERVKSEEALEETERKLRMMIDNINEGLVIIQDYRILFANRMVADVTGKTAEELNGMPFLEFVHAEDRERVAEYHTSRIEGGDAPLSFDCRITNKHNEVRWLRVNTTLIDWHGRPASLATLRDVTERKAIEETLAREHRTLNSILDNIPVMIMMFDQRGDVRLVNQAFEHSLGWTADDFKDANMMSLCFPDEQYRQSVWTYLLGAEDRWLDLTVQTKGGGTLLSAWNSISLADGLQIAIGIDVREKRETEDCLLRERELLKRVLDNIPVMITVRDSHGRIQIVNPEFEKTLGWSREDLATHNSLELRFPDPAYRRQVEDFIVNHPGEWRDFDVTTKWGPLIASSWTYVHLSDGSQIGIGVDMRDRKRAERALLEAYGKLGVERTTLERKNTALREVLAQFDSKKKEIRESIASNIGEVVLPTLRRIKEAAPDDSFRKVIDLVERELKDIASPLIPKLKRQYGRLTRREQEVVHLVKQGMDTRQVAEAMGLSRPTVQKYRELIRKKLDLRGQGVNLKSFLKSLDQEEQ